MGIMERLAPRGWALEDDNVGLLVGSPNQVVHGIVVALDLNREVVGRVLDSGANLVVTHHPAIFRPLSALRTDLPQGALLAQVVRSEVAVFSAHTNLDVCEGGVSSRLAEVLGLQDTEVLAVTGAERFVKIVVFVPAEAAETVRAALGESGAGHLGQYSHCSFQVSGTGRFKPLEGSKPFIGRAGEVAEVPEVRVETIVRQRELARVVRAMLAAHPYEEAAYDVYPLEDRGLTYGLGRVGRLAEPVKLGDFAALVKDRLVAPGVRVVGDLDRAVRKVAVLGGSGGKYVRQAVFAGADVLVLGDLSYHDAEDARELGLAVIDAGHGPTERVVLDSVAQLLREGLTEQGETVPIQVLQPVEETFRFL